MKQNFSFKEGMVLYSFSPLEVREAATAPGFFFFGKRNQIVLFETISIRLHVLVCFCFGFLFVCLFFWVFFFGGGGGCHQRPELEGL